MNHLTCFRHDGRCLNASQREKLHLTDDDDGGDDEGGNEKGLHST